MLCGRVANELPRMSCGMGQIDCPSKISHYRVEIRIIFHNQNILFWGCDESLKRKLSTSFKHHQSMEQIVVTIVAGWLNINYGAIMYLDKFDSRKHINDIISVSCPHPQRDLLSSHFCLVLACHSTR